METDHKKQNSKISYSFTLDSSSALFRLQTVNLYSEELHLRRFLPGKLRIRQHEIKWACPQDTQSGSLPLKGIYKKMKVGQGLLVASDAVLHLQESTGLPSETENLIYLSSENSSMYILFQDWNSMDAWVTDFLVLLNDFECESVLPKNFTSTAPQFWLWNLDYKRLTPQEIELEIELQSHNHKFQRFKTRINLEDSPINQLDDCVLSSHICIDSVARELIESFFMNCQREIMVSEMSRDVLSLHTKKIEFQAQKARITMKKNAEWYSYLEKKHRASLITAQLDAIYASNNDSVIQCFRLVELQKYTLQEHLRKLSMHLINTEQSDEVIHSVNDRLLELMKQREAVNNQTHSNTIKDCSCNCVLL